MSYLRLPNSIIDKVEKWERRLLHQNSDNEVIEPRYRHNSITSNVFKTFGVLYIGVPFFAIMLILTLLPISNETKGLIFFIFVLITTIAIIGTLIYLKKRGHKV